MIRKATSEDMNRILEIYRTARAFMKKTGNDQQWGDSYPPVELIESDIRQGQLYVVVENGAVHGVFVLMFGDEPAYQLIEHGSWKADGPYATIHRVASDGQVKGIFGQCLTFCKSQFGNIRIDTHHDNKTMQHLIERSGFARCGIVHMDDGSPRIAYQYCGDCH